MMLVGQHVAWPKVCTPFNRLSNANSRGMFQLHIIENRYRLEREIFRGRQAVRKSLKTRDRVPVPEDISSHDPGNVPDSALSPPLPSTSTSTGPADVEPPLSVDTDTETGFAPPAYGSRRGRTSPPEFISGGSTPRSVESSQDPLRSPSRRRRWASQLLDDEEVGGSRAVRDDRAGTPDPPPEISQLKFPEAEQPRPQSFLSRLRSRSFPHFSSPFSTMRGTSKMQSKEMVNDDAWSSDSSEDELPLNGRSPFSGAFSDDIKPGVNDQGREEDPWGDREDEDEDHRSTEEQ